jgi:hypothetical protein
MVQRHMLYEDLLLSKKWVAVALHQALSSIYISKEHHEVDPLFPVVMNDSPQPHSPLEFGFMNTNSDLQQKPPRYLPKSDKLTEVQH